MNKLQFKAVFFDLDGTLLYTLPDIAAAVNHALHIKGFPPVPVEEYRTKVGWGLEETVRRAIPQEHQANASESGLLKELTAEMIREYRRKPYQLTTPYEGIPELLRELQERGIPMSILSNKEHTLTNMIVKELFPDVKFLRVQGTSETVPPKPDQTGIQSLLAEVGFNSHTGKSSQVLNTTVLYVGDSGVDMDTAVQANVYPLGVAWGYRPAQELFERGAKQVLNEPFELISLFPDLLLDRM